MTPSGHRPAEGAADFHGLTIAWSTRGLDRDPARRLFAAFPASTRPPAGADLVLSIDAAPLNDDASGFRPSFFQGNVRGLERDGELLILAPAARLRVARDGKRIQATVDPATLNETGFVNTTLVIALSVALRQHGLFHLHAGALVRADGARVLVLGDSGSGKSTLTLTLLADRQGEGQQGEAPRFLGDDTLFVASRAGKATLLAFPRPFHLGPKTARAFPHLRADPTHDDAKLHVPTGALPGTPSLAMDAPDVVLFPRITDEPATSATPLSRSDAFGLALRSCAFVAVDGLDRKTEQLELLRDLLGSGRSFDVALGRDGLEDPARVVRAIPWDIPSH